VRVTYVDEHVQMSDVAADGRSIELQPTTGRTRPVARWIGWILVAVTSLLIGAYAVVPTVTGFAFVPEVVLASLVGGLLISVGLNTWVSIGYLHRLGWEIAGDEQVRGRVRWRAGRTVGRNSRPLLSPAC
jgi:hypothetical protein